MRTASVVPRRTSSSPVSAVPKQVAPARTLSPPLPDLEEEDELEVPTEEGSDLFEDFFGPPPLPYPLEGPGYSRTSHSNEDYDRDEAKQLANQLVESHREQLLQAYHNPEVDFLGYLSSLILGDLPEE